jgi:hypothetical protein
MAEQQGQIMALLQQGLLCTEVLLVVGMITLRQDQVEPATTAVMAALQVLLAMEQRVLRLRAAAVLARILLEIQALAVVVK